MGTQRNTPLELLNASGFAFQLAVEASVPKSGDSDERWLIERREYPWKTDAGSGYIDVVLSRGNLFVAIECKRTKEATWLFLIPELEQLSRTHAKVRWTNSVPHRRQLADWGDVQVRPPSPEAEFCSIRGTGEKDAPLLERIGGTLTESIEGLSCDLLAIDAGSRRSRIILPVIVTNASLKLAQFVPSEVDLSSGNVGNVEFKDVDHLRFRKSLSIGTIPDDLDGARLRDLARSSERTIFVVNASKFPTWLKELDLDASSPPWIYARDREEAEG